MKTYNVYRQGFEVSWLVLLNVALTQWPMHWLNVASQVDDELVWLEDCPQLTLEALYFGSLGLS